MDRRTGSKEELLGQEKDNIDCLTDELVEQKYEETENIDFCASNLTGNIIGNAIGGTISNILKVDKNFEKSSNNETKSTNENKETQTKVEVVNENDKTKKNSGKKDKKKPKKKQKPAIYLNKSVKLGNIKKVDTRQVMAVMLENIKQEEKFWTRMWKKMKLANLSVVLIVMGINFTQVLINVIGLDKNLIQILSTCLPVLSSLFISFQNKFGWDDKAEISKESVDFYRRIMKHVEARIRLDEVGVKVGDVINLWNASLVSEMNEIPQAIVPF